MNASALLLRSAVVRFPASLRCPTAMADGLSSFFCTMASKAIIRRDKRIHNRMKGKVVVFHSWWKGTANSSSWSDSVSDKKRLGVFAGISETGWLFGLQGQKYEKIVALCHHKLAEILMCLCRIRPVKCYPALCRCKSNNSISASPKRRAGA